MSTDSQITNTTVDGSNTILAGTTTGNLDKTKSTFRASQRPAEKKTTEWLLDQKTIGVDFDFPHKKRRYVNLKPQLMFDSLAELYQKWFASIWNHINRVADENGVTSTDQIHRTLRLARIYISCWFRDLYISIRRALLKTDNTAFGQKYSVNILPTNIKYDVYLVDLLNAIRPTHIVHNTADEMLIPLITTHPDQGVTSLFGIEKFDADIQTMAAINRIMIEKKLCVFGTINDATTGTPVWLFDHVTHNDEAALYAWFPAEGNYTSIDLLLAFIIGCACSPRIGLVEIDEWRWAPRNAPNNYPVPAFQDQYNSERHNYGSVELTTTEVQNGIPAPDYYNFPNAPKTGQGPLYLQASTSTTTTEISLDENTEVPKSPSYEDRAMTDAADADVVYMTRYRYVTKIYHAQVARRMTFEARYLALHSYLQDD